MRSKSYVRESEHNWKWVLQQASGHVSINKQAQMKVILTFFTLTFYLNLNK
jgi:hypothetical protein